MINYAKSNNWGLQSIQKLGKLTFSQKKCKKHWKHYFIDVDDYDEDEYTFGSEWVGQNEISIKSTKKTIDIPNSSF